MSDMKPFDLTDPCACGICKMYPPGTPAPTGPDSGLAREMHEAIERQRAEMHERMEMLAGLWTQLGDAIPIEPPGGYVATEQPPSPIVEVLAVDPKTGTVTVLGVKR